MATDLRVTTLALRQGRDETSAFGKDRSTSSSWAAWTLAVKAFLAVSITACRRECVEPCEGDLLATLMADTVCTGLDPLECGIDLLK